MKRVILSSSNIKDDVVERIAYRFSLAGESDDERSFIRTIAVPQWLRNNLQVDPNGTAIHIYTRDGYDFGEQQKRFWWGDKFNTLADFLADKWYKKNRSYIKDSVGEDRRDYDMYEYAYYLAEWCLDQMGEYDAENIAYQTMKKFNVSRDDETMLNELVNFLEE